MGQADGKPRIAADWLGDPPRLTRLADRMARKVPGQIEVRPRQNHLPLLAMYRQLQLICNSRHNAKCSLPSWPWRGRRLAPTAASVSYTHLRAHETGRNLV